MAVPFLPPSKRARDEPTTDRIGMGWEMKRALVLGTVAALFFASTFVLNRAMTLDGGNVLWLAGLRYLFTVPLLGAVVLMRREGALIWRELRLRPGPWLLWGTIGFGLFYLPLTWVARWAPAWLVAGSWQLTIVLGSLLVPFIEPDPQKRRIPVADLWPSAVILAGVALTEWLSHGHLGPHLWEALLLVMIAAIAYPLGNRQMMRYTRHRSADFSVYQRTLGMTLGSMPFWIVTMGIGWVQQGLPSIHVTLGALAIALFSGVVATLLFFAATDLAQGRASWLARIEATQSLEIVFTVLLASLLFGQRWPTAEQGLGLLIIMAGMILHSRPRPQPQPENNEATWSG